MANIRQNRKIELVGKIGRYLCTGEVRCTNRCQYCFANWKTAPTFDTIYQLPKENREPFVLYPVCDSETRIQRAKLLEKMEKILECNEEVIISISTKNFWFDADLEKIMKLNQKYSIPRIKLGVSLTCKDLTSVIEPKAAIYSERMKLLQRIDQLHIPHNVILKPLLPFIDCFEYYQIIEDCIPYCNDFVIGDLYIEKDSPFSHKYKLHSYKIKMKYCTWMERKVLFVEHPKRVEIFNRILEKGAYVYESDLDFCKKLLEGRKFAQC